MLLGRQACANQAADACLQKYRNLLISKVLLLMSQLAPFAKFGNAGHQRYMQEIDSSECIKEPTVRYNRQKNSSHVCLCGIPGVSQVKPLEFVADDQQCSNFKWGCTQPHY